MTALPFFNNQSFVVGLVFMLFVLGGAVVYSLWSDRRSQAAKRRWAPRTTMTKAVRPSDPAKMASQTEHCCVSFDAANRITTTEFYSLESRRQDQTEDPQGWSLVAQQSHPEGSAYFFDRPA
jgi:hypothetical protein